MDSAWQRGLTGRSLLLSVVLAFALVFGGISQGIHRHTHGDARHHVQEFASVLTVASHAHEAPASNTSFDGCHHRPGLEQCTGASCTFCAPPAETWQPERPRGVRVTPGSNELQAPLAAAPPTPPPKLSS